MKLTNVILTYFPPVSGRNDSKTLKEEENFITQKPQLSVSDVIKFGT